MIGSTSCNDSSSSSSQSGSDSSLGDMKFEASTDVGVEINTRNTRNTSPELPHLPEPKNLLSLRTNIEIGIVSSMDERDKWLMTMAEIRRDVAKAQMKLAQCRSKEASVSHRLYCIGEEVAKKRFMQAELDLERAQHYQKRRSENPRLVAAPQEILTDLGRPITYVSGDEIQVM